MILYLPSEILNAAEKVYTIVCANAKANPVRGRRWRLWKDLIFTKMNSSSTMHVDPEKKGSDVNLDATLAEMMLSARAMNSKRKRASAGKLVARSTKKGRTAKSDTTQKSHTDPNDDICTLCCDGGDLVCCDNCPSSYHQSCLSAQDLPEGSWYCPNCVCMTCGDVANAKEDSKVLECSQCEHKYHETCIKKRATDYVAPGSSTWFCGESCRLVYEGFRSRVGDVNPIRDGFSWSILRCNHDNQRVGSTKETAVSANCNAKLKVARSVMEECFLPMVDQRTGINILPHVLFNLGSRFARLNYQGFYAVVLEKSGALVSVASIRVHGVTVAEMPLIATCSRFQRQGMCRTLLNEIEKLLRSLKVKMLVLSAIPSVVETWTLGFGFKPVEDEDKQLLANVNLMRFPGTVYLKKNLHED